MVTAMAYPEGRQGKKDTSGLNHEVDMSYVRRARFVLRNNLIPEGQQYPDRCLAVMAGTLALTEAYAKTQEDVKQREEEEHIRQENLAKLTAIRGRYPDIAGRAELSVWQDRDGNHHPGLSLVADEIATLRGKPKPRSEGEPRNPSQQPRRRDRARQPEAAGAGVPFDDMGDWQP